MAGSAAAAGAACSNWRRCMRAPSLYARPGGRSAVAGKVGLPPGRRVFRLPRLTLRRAREERLAQVAGSLAFTTLLSMVPFLAVSFALFARLRVFKPLETAIQEHLLRSLLPEDISR